jgi:hypothetical protein
VPPADALPPSVGGTTPAPNLTNTTGADQIVVIGSAITGITFHNSGGSIASCTVAPTLSCSDCVQSKSPHLSWGATDGTSCTVNTQTSW